MAGGNQASTDSIRGGARPCTAHAMGSAPVAAVHTYICTKKTAGDDLQGKCTGTHACQDVCYLVCKAVPFPADHVGRTGLQRQCSALNDFPLLVLISY